MLYGFGGEDPTPAIMGYVVEEDSDHWTGRPYTTPLLAIHS